MEPLNNSVEFPANMKCRGGLRRTPQPGHLSLGDVWDCITLPLHLMSRTLTGDIRTATMPVESWYTEYGESIEIPYFRTP